MNINLNYTIFEDITITMDGTQKTFHYFFASFRNEIDASQYMETLKKTEYDTDEISKHYSLQEIML